MVVIAVAVRILAAIAEAVQSGLVVSKRYVRRNNSGTFEVGETNHGEFNRDIYYNDPACFGSQRVVDMVVDDIAHTIGVDRAALNVVRQCHFPRSPGIRIDTEDRKQLQRDWLQVITD